MKCFYHNDADGQMAAMWVLESGANPTNDEEEYIAIQYGDIFPFETICEQEKIFIVDYSIEPDEMSRLLTITDDVTWIDHHKTAIEKYADYHKQLRGIRYDGVSGCELTWFYLNKMTKYGLGEIKMAEDMDKYIQHSLQMLCPMHTRFIGDRDVWKYQFEDTRNFYDGYQTLDHGIEALHNFFIQTYDWTKTDLISIGYHIGKFKKQQREHVINSYAFETTFDGHTCLVCNSTDKTSELFGDRFEDYDMCGVYCWNGELYTVSLYSTKIDVSEIAKQYGGGGHKGAAGFTHMLPPFLKDYTHD